MKLNRRAVGLLVSLTLLLTAVVGSTVAFIVAQSQKKTNVFQPSRVACEVIKKSDNTYTVKNTGDTDAYIRVAVLVNWKNTDGHIYAQAPGFDVSGEFWVLGKDGYYYYTKILKPGDISEPVMTEFSLSEDVGNDYAGATGKIIITLDLLQAGGGAESCWNIEYKDLGIEYVKPSGELLTTTIEFKGSTEGFVFDVNGGDLFHNFKNMVPGESVSQLISVTNNSKEDVELFLWAEPDDVNLDSRQKELLEKYSVLTIADDKGEILYEGALLPEDIESRLHTSLGLFSSRETKNLYLSLKIAPEIGNDFQNLNTSLDWGLKAMGQEFEVPETGDNSNIGVWIGLAGVGAGGFIAACVLAIKQKKEEDDE